MHRYKEHYCDDKRRNNFPYIDAYVRITLHYKIHYNTLLEQCFKKKKTLYFVTLILFVYRADCKIRAFYHNSTCTQIYNVHTICNTNRIVIGKERYGIHRYKANRKLVFCYFFCNCCIIFVSQFVTCSNLALP